MQVGLADFLSNLLFWVLVIAAKLAFDWYAVMKPLEAPVLGLWSRGCGNAGSDDSIADG